MQGRKERRENKERQRVKERKFCKQGRKITATTLH